MERIINRYKQIRKQAALAKEYAHAYAFIGLGTHALQNLYPVIDYLNVPVKYIVTRSTKSAEMVKRIRKCEGTTNLDTVLSDESVKGVFICTSSDSHFQLVERVLNTGKNVFVEKPPCTSIETLEALIEIKNRMQSEVFVGLQRRYSPAFSILKSRLMKVNHYVYRYATGAFPDGDALFELFIHPIDALHFLFGKAAVKSCLRNKNTYLLNLRHENGIIGSIELSTDYSWKEPIEYLSINSEKNIFILNGLDSLTLHRKPKTIAQIPLEKIMEHVPQHTVLFSRNSFVPDMRSNDLFIHGFYNELKYFVDFCETGNRKLNKSELEEIRDTYMTLDNINRF